MKNIFRLFFLAGSLIGIGVFLSFYGSTLVTEDFIQIEQHLEQNSEFTFSHFLNSDDNKRGIVVIYSESPNDISGSIFDPVGIEISNFITKEQNPFQKEFEMTQTGNYTLKIVNQGPGNNVIGALGTSGNEDAILIINVGTICTVLGLVGIIITGIFLVKNRKNMVS